MRLFFAFILFFLISISGASENLIKPNTTLKPIEVLKIQLNSLKNNNVPYKDAGIEQTWEFAHPDNRKITGPLANFINMIHGINYQILINHESSEIKTINKSLSKVIYEVYILSKDKKKYLYIWQIEKVSDKKKFKDCWMTTSVLSPIFLGDTI